MDHKLSIIIPCYNCSTTLTESIDSLFFQNLKLPFEVVLVDDSSTDNTRQVMAELAKKYSPIKLFFHGKNQGGGATRNTAITHTTGDIIFCLDSDDIIPPNTLQKMLDLMLEKKLDGVLFEDKRFFASNIKNNRGSDKNLITDKPIELRDLFEGVHGPLTLVNFIYSKEAFLKAGGYPTNHGFDTQGFGFRFLAKNLSVGVCPDSIYYQRIGSKKAYFASVYEKGELSRNMFLIFSEIIYLFSKKTRQIIMSYDIFKNTKLGDNNIISVLSKLYKSDPESFFAEKKEKFMTENGFLKFYNEYKNSKELADIFCLGLCSYNQGDHEKSYEYFDTLKRAGLDSSVISYVMFRSSLAMKKENLGINFDTLTLEHFTPTRQKINLNPNFIIKALVRLKLFIYKIIKNEQK